MNYKEMRVVLEGMECNISLRRGDGGSDLVFFIHGLGCSKESFDDVWDFAGLSGFSIITFDLPGFGLSRSENFSYEMEDHAAVCKKLLSMFQYERLHIVAHSMGCAIGLLLTGLLDDGPASFICIEGNLVGDDSRMSRMVSKVSYQKFTGELLEYLISRAGISTEIGIRLWARLSRMSQPEGFYKSSHSLVRWSDSGSLLKIYNDLKCRKAYYHGEKSTHLKVLKILNSMERISIKNCGHFPMNDNPDEFYSKLADFLLVRV
jgi:pimeloyl-ACP methyl ester carboxylesterase